MFKFLPIVMVNHEQAPTVVGHVSLSLIAEPEQPLFRAPVLTSTNPEHHFSSVSTAHQCFLPL